MRAASAAALLLVATAVALAASPAAAQKHGGGSPEVTQCRFGWVPVTFDSKPWQQLPLDPQRRPKLLNLRCTAACDALGLQAVMTGDADASLQKPLCYFERKRMLGAPYKIYGSWYAGEESAGYESTCRGRIETGQQTQEWAMRWNETSQAMQFGYYCGCSGCTQGCWNSAPGATPRDPNGRFDCSAPAPGTLPPFPKANKYWPYWFTGPNFEANGNPNSTATDACNDPRYGGGANNFPYPICKGRTAAFGEEWGTMDSDFTCKTYNSLVVDSPSFFCTTSPADKTAFPPPPAPGKPGHLMGLGLSSRLDLVMGATEPTEALPSKDALQRLSPAVFTRTEEVMP